MKTAYCFEDYLVELHASQYEGLDDEMPENCSEWIADLDVDTLIKYANQFAKEKMAETARECREAISK